MAQVYSRVRAVLLIGVLLVAAGCGGGSSAEPRRTGTAAGIAVYEVPGENFSIGVPEAWNAISADRVLKGDAMDSVVAQNPELKALMDAVRSGNVMKFFAFDPAVKNGFATNVNVVVEPLPGEMTLDSYVTAALGQLKKVPFLAGAIDHERVSMPAGPAEKVSYPSEFSVATGKQTLATLQYMFVRGKNAYVVTFGTLPTQTDEYAARFTRMVESFRIEP